MHKISWDGRILAHPVGAELGPYAIEAVQAWQDRWVYRVTRGSVTGVLMEGPAYVSLAYQNEHWQAILPVIRYQSLDILDHFQLSFGTLTLQYTLFPEKIWEAFQMPAVSHSFLDPVEIEYWYQWQKEIQNRLQEVGWCNPSLALPLTYRRSSREWWALEWDYCVPLEKNAQPTRFLSGYHYAVSLLSTSSKKKDVPILQLCWSASYSSLLVLLQGRPAQLWGQQPIEYSAIRSVLSAEMRGFLEHWPQQSELWPDLPSRLFRNQEAYQQYQRSVECWQSAREALTKQNGQLAGELAQQAHELALNDPWPLLLMAEIAMAQGNKQMALERLSRVLQMAPLTAAFKLWVPLQLEYGNGAAAEAALSSWLKQSPQDDAAWALQGRLLAQKGQTHSAIESYRNALQKRPHHVPYQRALQQLIDDPQSSSALFSFSPEQTYSVAWKKKDRPCDSKWQAGEKKGVWKLRSPLSRLYRGRQIWLASDMNSEQLVCLKHFSSSLPFYLQDANAEMKALQILKNPCFLPLLTHWQDEEGATLVYPWIEGPTLRAHLDTGCLDPSKWQLLAEQIYFSLVSLHAQGMTHGDICPDNLIWHEGKQTWCFVDYDHLSLVEDKRPLHAQTTYAAPEIWQAGQLSPEHDMYSFALVLLEAASGLSPELMRNWEKQNFDFYRRYTPYLSSEQQSMLLHACAWKQQQRHVLRPYFWLNISHAPQLLERQSNLACRLQALFQITDADVLHASLAKILAREKSVLTYGQALFHTWRLKLIQEMHTYAQTVLRACPFYLPAYWILAEQALDQGHGEVAKSLLLKAMHYDSQALDTYRLLVRCYTQLNQKRLAWAACDQMARWAPLLPDAELQRFFVLLAWGDLQGALKIGQALLMADLRSEAQQIFLEHWTQLQKALSSMTRYSPIKSQGYRDFR